MADKVKKKNNVLSLGTAFALAGFLVSAYADFAKAQEVDLSEKGFVQLAGGEKVSLSNFKGRNGQEIKFTQFEQSQLQRNMMEASFIGGQQYIRINSLALKLNFQQFVFFLEHERGHFVEGHQEQLYHAQREARKEIHSAMGDVKRGEVVKKAAINKIISLLTKNELKADCFAVQAVKRKYGMDIDDIRAISKAFKENGSAVHPTREKRTQNAIACFEGNTNQAVLPR